MSAKPRANRRMIVKGVLISFATVLFPFVANAAGPTLKATKVGQKIVWRGYVYTVVSSKGKLVWKQGAKVAVATASATPSASATAAPTPTSIATSTPASTPTPTSTPTESATPISTIRPDLGVFITASSKLKEGDFAIFQARNSKGQLLNYALSRKNGVVRAFSTECTHAGCVVQASRDDLWCPCHSSNFDAFTGKATGGPAINPLATYVATEADGSIFIKI